ncbi:MAG: asparagine synthase (glutamine-hydrolyzing) [Propionicimonas sp.]
MCGVCGIVDLDQQPEVDIVTGMMGRLRHRGPDGSGYFRDNRAILGHTRLAIIDQAGGGQPLCNEDGSLWVTFNGEIFNYVELGRELRALGHTFRTASDTEVIVHAWEEWGEGAFSRFNGQWAIGLWDRRRRRLVLSRDRLGVRPLYLVRRGNRLAFASEVKALFADPSIKRELDPVGLDQTFTYWSTVAPRTVFAGVQQLPPGHVAVFDADGFRTAPYWTIDFPEQGREPNQDTEENAAALRERLIEATRLRFLRSDVPVGAYLSGGIDSSVTAGVIANYTDAPLHTFSLRFSDSEFDEGRYQGLMAERLGTEHRDIVVTQADIADVFSEVIWHAETPILRAAPAPLFLLSKLVRDNGYKVVVTGEGADEVLAGYDIFREARVRLFWSRDPASTKRARAAELLYPWMARSPGQAPAFARSFFGRNLDPDDPALSHRPRWDSTSALKALLSPEMSGSIGPGSTGEELVAAMPEHSGKWDPLGRAQWLEMTTLLAGYILAPQGDRMLMANSVEGRFPFLDRDVVDFANALPARHKLFGLEEKYLLKRAFHDLIPDEILNRPKQPYRAPDASSFFAGPAPEWFADVTSEAAIRAAGVFDPTVVGGLFAKCARTAGARMSNTDNMRVLAVVSTQLTHQHFVAQDGSANSDQTPPQPMIVHDMGTEEWSTT